MLLSTRSSTAWLGHRAAAPNLRCRLLDRGFWSPPSQRNLGSRESALTFIVTPAVLSSGKGARRTNATVGTGQYQDHCYRSQDVPAQINSGTGVVAVSLPQFGIV
jgi:hypothetical protein